MTKGGAEHSEFVLPLRNPELGNLNLLKWEVGQLELRSEGDIVFIILDSKQITFCFRETLSLNSRAIPYTIILEKIVWNKRAVNISPCKKYRNTNDPWRIVSQQDAAR